MKQLIETENSHDVEKVLTFLTDDIVFEDVTFGVIMRGKDGFKEIYPTFITTPPEFKLEPKAWVTDDKSFAIEMVYSGRQKGDFPDLPATGKPFSIRMCSFGERIFRSYSRGQGARYADSRSRTLVTSGKFRLLQKYFSFKRKIYFYFIVIVHYYILL